MGKIKRMDQVRLLLKTYQQTQSIKGTARRLQVSKNTVRTYLKRAESYSKDLSEVLSLKEEAFIKLLYPPADPKEDDRRLYFDAQVNYWLKELRKVGVSRQLLWVEYCEEQEANKRSSYSYSQFCERLRKKVAQRNLSISLNHVPGEVMQLDFAGKKLSWVDMETGQVHTSEVLVAVFPHSHYSFAIALPSQKVGDFIHGINEAFLYFGALPKVILSDNLKSYVSRADRYEPKFNALCEQLSEHYQVELRATRVGKPKDKASVENLVRTVYNRVYGPLRNKVFGSLRELNQGIRKQLAIHNLKAYQNKEGCRKEVFKDFEYPLMRSLPQELFELKKVTQAKVQRNYHVFLGEEKNYYSVPFKYVGAQTTVIYTSTRVEVYLQNKRIAIHERLPGKRTYFYQTQMSHMPHSHQQWLKAQGYDEKYFIEQAQKIGPATSWAIEYILSTRKHQAQAYNTCKGILQLAQKYSTQRLEAASIRCQKISKTSYTILKRILQLGLDLQQEQTMLFNMPEHDNIRGPKSYQ